MEMREDLESAAINIFSIWKSHSTNLAVARMMRKQTARVLGRYEFGNLEIVSDRTTWKCGYDSQIVSLSLALSVDCVTERRLRTKKQWMRNWRLVHGDDANE